jgi:hypothetical protein
MRTSAVKGPISLGSGFNPYATEPCRRFTDEDLRARKQERKLAREEAKAIKRTHGVRAQERPASPQYRPTEKPVPGLNMSFTMSLNDRDKGF